MRSLSIGATGMLAQQMNVEVISNNIANISTGGFKKQRAEFQDLLYQTVSRPGSTSSDVGTIVPAGIQLGSGVKAAGIYRIHEQGSIEITDNEYDVAIQGNGYFVVELPNGETGYTRNGSFQLSPDGEIVNQDGHRVSPGITVPAEAIDVEINASGEVLVKLSDQEAFTNVGQLELAIFNNPVGLDSKGRNIFMETEASGAPTIGTPGQEGVGTIMQGGLESSNVNIVSEITKLISAQRAYEMNSKVIKTSDEMMSAMNQLR